jgi:hypothetical protein
VAERRELFVGLDEDGGLMSMTPDGRVVPANIELGETPKALVLKRAADFIQQMTQQTVRHEEAREQIVSRIDSWTEPQQYLLWAQSIQALADADRQLAEGVARVVAAMASVTPDEIKMDPKPKTKLTDFAGMSKAAISRELGFDESRKKEQL